MARNANQTILISLSIAYTALIMTKHIKLSWLFQT